MKGRSRVVVLGLILMMATVGTLWYHHGIKYGIAHGRPMVAVIVLKVDIPAGTDMNQLIKDDQFRLIELPQEAAIDGAVTSLHQLRGESNHVAILAGEQIPIALFWSVGAMRRERLEFLGA